MPTWFWALYGLAALSASILYSLYAVRIFLDTTKDPWKTKAKEKPFLYHQLWLNFVGSLSGWLALAYLVAYRRQSIADGDMGLADVAVVLLTLLGITGLLPNALFLGKFPR